MIPLLNESGRITLAAGTSLLFQTAALVAALLLVESVARHRLRSALRCGLWLLVIAKLLLPPTLISPVSPGYWLGRWIAPPIQGSKHSPTPHSPGPRTSLPSAAEIQTEPEAIGRTDRGPIAIQHPTLELAGLLLCLWVAGSLLFSGWLIRRNRHVHRLVRSAVPASLPLQGAMERAARQVGLKRIPELRLSAKDHSPAVCGFLRPVIVLPATLAESLDPAALRDVLLHELIHIRRGDLWIHFPQTLAQVLWWWNPLSWLANARIRVLREQAVDEEVMLCTGREHDATYPETLVAVARYCSTRPLLLSLNLVGILESRRDLRARVEHLLHHPLPRRAGLGVTGWAVLAAVAVLGLPMAYSRRVEAAAAAPTTPSPVLAGEEIAIGTTISTNVVGYFTLHTFSTTNAPTGDPGRREQTRVMPPELARRYGLTPMNSTGANNVFSNAREKPLQSRDFNVDPGTLVRGIESVTGSPDGTPAGVIRFPDELQPRIAEFFKAAGISVTVGQSENPQSTGGTFNYDPVSGWLTVRATPNELSMVQSALNALVVPPPEAEIELRVTQLDSSPGSTASLQLDSAALDTREAVLSGTTTLSDSFLVDQSGTGKPLGRELVTLRRPARSGRRVNVSFAEAQLNPEPGNTATDAAEPSVVEILPIIRSDAADFDLHVVVRRSPTDPAPIQRRVTVKPGQSLVIVSGPFNPDSPSKPLLFSLTPTVMDPARRKP